MPPSIRKSHSKFFDVDLPAGENWEQQFLVLMAGKIECKRDRAAHKTGNIFIEYQFNGKPSGLAITEASWWAIGIDGKTGDVETAILVSVAWLKAKCRSFIGTKRDVRGGDRTKARGILLRMDDFRS